jgi:hypothetical protein
MSRIRGPYVRFCERDGASLICSPHPTRFENEVTFFDSLSKKCLFNYPLAILQRLFTEEKSFIKNRGKTLV